MFYYFKNGQKIYTNNYEISYNVANDLYTKPLDEEYRYACNYIVTDSIKYGYSYDTNDLSSINDIKQAIMENGCLTLSYNYDAQSNIGNDPSDDSNLGYYLPAKAQEALDSKIGICTNHAISVIGWDDNFSKENFFNTKSAYTYTDVRTDKIKTFTAEELPPHSKRCMALTKQLGQQLRKRRILLYFL